MRWFYDIEAEAWDRPLLVVAQREDGEEKVFHGPDSTRQVAELMRREGGEWIAHAGGIYDHLLVWRDSSWPRDVVLAGSSVQRASDYPVKGRPSLQWLDSMPLWGVGLDVVGRAIGLPKLEADRATLEKLPPEELVAYCRRDVEILRRGWLAEAEWLAQFGVTARTSGSAAVKLLAAMDAPSWGVMADCLVDPKLSTGARGRPGALSAIRGGRTETRRVGLVEGPVYVYDLHSSYPSQFACGAVPVGLEPDDSRDLSAWGWLDLVTWLAPRRDDHRTAFELSRDGRGVGALTAWLTWEQAWALDQRGMQPRRHGCGWRPEGRCEAFAAPFVKELYRLKEDKTKVESFFAKVTLNSLHGRLGMDPVRFNYVKNAAATVDGMTSWRQAYCPRKTRLQVTPDQQPLAAACILARGRLNLAVAIEALEERGWAFYYADTDSLHTNCPPEEFARFLPLGPGIGFWGHEGTASSAVYLAAKTYHLQLDGKEKTAAKGMPKDALTRDRFLAAARGDVVELGRGGLGRIRAGDTAGRAVELTRTMRPVHVGRTRLASGVLRYDD